jgi:hypothetical protein
MDVFSTKECAWQNTSITVLGRKVTGLRGFEFKKTVEKEHLYAAGSAPIDIQDGNKKYEGNLKLLKYEVDLLNDAALTAGFADITEVPHESILITTEYKKVVTDKPRKIIAAGVGFTEMGFAMEQNAKMTEVTLPFIAINIQVG